MPKRTGAFGSCFLVGLTLPVVLIVDIGTGAFGNSRLMFVLTRKYYDYSQTKERL